MTAVELRPLIHSAERRLSDPRSAELVVALEKQWRVVLGIAAGIVGDYKSGRPVIAWARDAAVKVHELNNGTTVRAIIVATLAMFAMREMVPHRFATDRAFRFQLVRRVRSLAPVNTRVTQSGPLRAKRSFRDLPPRQVEQIADWLSAAFGSAGISLARAEMREAEIAEQRRTKLHDAIRSAIEGGQP